MADVRMTHAGLDGREITVADTAVPIHMASGWVPVEETVETAKADEKADADPSDTSTTEVAAEGETEKSGSKSTRRTASKE